MSARILLVGGTSKIEYLSSLQRSWDVIIASSGKQALLMAHADHLALILVDAVSMRTSGERICRALKKAFPNCPMIHIQPESYDAESEKIAEITICPPFTSRKLIGIINRLVKDPQTDSITCGPFAINPTTRILLAHGQEIQLNPKQADLIQLFLTHPNEILDRETIMKQVWETNYMGDTRTLDVHIRHVRNALENGKNTPRYLKTVRGVGYCLEIPPERSN